MDVVPASATEAQRDGRFSCIVYKSRADRDRINAKVMADPRLAGMDPKDMPFDGKRMIFGGFKLIVDA